jgi:hypothetical protein
MHFSAAPENVEQIPDVPRDLGHAGHLKDAVLVFAPVIANGRFTSTRHSIACDQCLLSVRPKSARDYSRPTAAMMAAPAGALPRRSASAAASPAIVGLDGNHVNQAAALTWIGEKAGPDSTNSGYRA